jgi:hypothetical protein
VRAPSVSDPSPGDQETRTLINLTNGNRGMKQLACGIEVIFDMDRAENVSFTELLCF